MGERSFENRDEWELMYRQGVTPDKIAELCNVPVKRVNWTLGRRALFDPSVKTEHERNAPARAVDRKPGPPWTATLKEFERFTAEHGRPPGSKHDPAERALYRWLTRQRTSLAGGRLTAEQQKALDAAGPWRITLREHESSIRWARQLQELAVFFGSKQRWPSFKNRHDEEERRLGVWLHTQRQAALTGMMDPERRRRLEKTVPGWNTWRAP
jgi:Helicase associated domain